MAYKLLDAAQIRWRCVNAPHLVALVRAEAPFLDGELIEREDQQYAVITTSQSTPIDNISHRFASVATRAIVSRSPTPDQKDIAA
jgi:hypothetical protein